MQKISDLLEKFKNFGLKEKEQKEKFVNLLKKYNIDILENQFEIKDCKIFLKTTGVLKTEIILRKKEFLFELGSKIKDII